MGVNVTRRIFLAGLVPLVPTVAIAGATTFSYDALGRVTAALYPDAALTIYDYDAAGNRTAIKNPYVGPSITTDCFDANYYLRAYPDIAAAGVDPYTHFTVFGWKNNENRNPNSFFNTAGYKAAYPDVAAANVNPLTHYINNGATENRDPSGQFDTQLYRSANGLASGTNPLYHYLTVGYAAGLSPQGDGAFRLGV